MILNKDAWKQQWAKEPTARQIKEHHLGEEQLEINITISQNMKSVLVEIDSATTRSQKLWKRPYGRWEWSNSSVGIQKEPELVRPGVTLLHHPFQNVFTTVTNGWKMFHVQPEHQVAGEKE